MSLFLLVLGLLMTAAVVSTRTARRWGVPSLVLFVGIGMLAGSQGPGGIPFEDYQLAYDAGTLALALILFSGGLDTELHTLRRAAAPALGLATVGVLVKLGVMAGLALLLTPLDLTGALLLGAVLAPTDAAAVFSVLKGAGLPERLAGVLEVESGTNDPMAVYLTLALTTTLAGGTLDPAALLVGVAVQLGVGTVTGLVGGRLLDALLDRLRLDGSGLYPVLTLGGVLALFGGANLLGGNGFLAVYLAGLVLHHRQVSHLHEIRTSFDTLAWAAQIGMFLLLGLLSFPSRLLDAVLPALLLALGMVFVARPLSVIVAAWPVAGWFGSERLGWRDAVVLSWAGLKGAVPIILATVPLLHDIPEADVVFDTVFVVVILGTLLQGSTTVPLARRLGLLTPMPPEPSIRVALGGDAPRGSTIRTLWLDAVPDEGPTLAELGLGEGVVVTAVVRGDELLLPRGGLQLRQGDHVFVMSLHDDALPARLLALTT
jgi:cell volume regulation protein A